jgi:hypothetical protein
MSKDTEDYEKTFEEFWKPLGVMNPDGSANWDQIKRELHDFHTLMDSVGKVYCEVTDNHISKIMTSPECVIDEFNQLVERRIQEAIQEHDEQLQDNCLDRDTLI